MFKWNRLSIVFTTEQINLSKEKLSIVLHNREFNSTLYQIAVGGPALPLVTPPRSPAPIKCPG